MAQRRVHYLKVLIFFSALTNITCLSFNSRDHVPRNERFRRNVYQDHINLNLISTESCGTLPKPNIHKTDVAYLTDFPWLALLSYRKVKFFCTGSLINNRYILTTAQCVNSEHKLKGVRLGDYNLMSSNNCIDYDNKRFCKDLPLTYTVSWKDGIVHPKYDNTTYQNDIALIRLPKDVEFGAFIEPVCLPIFQTEPADGKGVYTITGWGIGIEGYSTEVLKFKNVLKMDDMACNNYLRSSTKLNADGNQFCTTSLDDGDLCIGDRGGAVVNSAESDLTYIQYGIISIKTDCSGAKKIVHTKVAPYIGWILDKIHP